MQISVMKKLISIRKWFDSLQLLTELSKLSNFDPKEVQTVIGYESEVGYFLDVFLPDRQILSIQFKSLSAKKYWMYLNIGSISIRTIDEDLITTDMLVYLVQSVKSVSNAAQYGSISLEPSFTGGINIIYTAPLPSWSLLSLVSFIRLIRSVVFEVQTTLKDVQSKNLVTYQNNQSASDEFADYEDYDENEGEEPQPNS
jgi:hypothetical protein